MRALLLIAFFLPATLPAQSTVEALADIAVALQPRTPDSGVRIGTYRADGASLQVARSGPRLVLTLAGQDAFDAFATVPADGRLNGRAEALLRNAFSGDADRLAAALPDHRRKAGVRDFTRLLGTLAERLGDATAVHALGTTADDDGTAATYLRVRFADGEELLKLKWRDGHLALITRGALPQVTAYPVRGDADRFAVLDADGEPATLLVFSQDQVTARNVDHTFIAARSF